MAKLTFWCIEETSEVSPSDSPYFLIYVGDAQKQKSVVTRLRRESWDDNIDAGEFRQASISFPNGTSFDLVLVALLEEDWDNDFNSSTLEKVRDWMNNLDGLLQPAIAQTPDVYNLIRQEFGKAIEKHGSNDDLLGVRRFTPGQQTRHFYGGGGHYKVKFEV